MLLRDVAYGQIPRAERAQKHRETAEWIESLGRPEDHAELLAFHWRSALELARAAGQDTTELETPTRLALREAGDRAFALNTFLVAADHYQAALTLWPDDDDRPRLLFRRAHALFLKADERREEALEAARDALLAAGDHELARRGGDPARAHAVGARPSRRSRCLSRARRRPRERRLAIGGEGTRAEHDRTPASASR